VAVDGELDEDEAEGRASCAPLWTTPNDKAQRVVFLCTRRSANFWIYCELWAVFIN